MYIVVEEFSPNHLMKKVDEYIKQGYELQGGIFIAITPNGRSYAQAIIRK